MRQSRFAFFRPEPRRHPWLARSDQNMRDTLNTTVSPRCRVIG